MFFEPYIIAQGRLMGKKKQQRFYFHLPKVAHQKSPKTTTIRTKKNLVVIISTVHVSTQHLPLFSHSLTINNQKQKHLGKQNFIETSLHRAVKIAWAFRTN